MNTSGLLQQVPQPCIARSWVRDERGGGAGPVIGEVADRRAPLEAAPAVGGRRRRWARRRRRRPRPRLRAAPPVGAGSRRR